MIEEIPYDEFLRDIRQQKREIRKPVKEPWEANQEALSRDEYDHLTLFGRRRLERPRPVWLNDKKRWTVGAPVNPIEWQILIQSEPTRAQSGKRVTETDVGETIVAICDQFWINKYTFSECVDRLQDRRLLKIRGGFRRSKIAGKWLFPDLTGPRAGGEWHRNSILDFIGEVNRIYGCYTYADRGYCPGVQMPDVIIVKPRLVKNTRHYDPQEEPLEWDMNNPVYAEFKSARDIREHPSRFEEQLERYDGIPLFLKVEAKFDRVKDWIEEHGRREVGLSDLIRKPEGDMVFLNCNFPPTEKSFVPVLDKIREAFSETYDRKARLKKTGTDPQGREYHDLILYDSLGTPKNVGQVIPDYADNVEDFADRFFAEGYLNRVITADYVYVPKRKPTPENKTWEWEKRKTKGSKFRSFSI